MKIGITCYPTYGGSGVVATELGLELAARGHEVHFISYAVPVRMTEPPSERIHFHEVEMLNYPLFNHPPYTLALATQMVNVAANESLDLLHVHYAIPHSVSAYLARAMRNPHRSSLCHHTARNGYYTRGSGSLLPSHNSVLDRTK